MNDKLNGRGNKWDEQRYNLLTNCEKNRRLVYAVNALEALISNL